MQYDGEVAQFFKNLHDVVRKKIAFQCPVSELNYKSIFSFLKK